MCDFFSLGGRNGEVKLKSSKKGKDRDTDKTGTWLPFSSFARPLLPSPSQIKPHQRWSHAYARKIARFLLNAATRSSTMATLLPLSHHRFVLCTAYYVRYPRIMPATGSTPIPNALPPKTHPSRTYRFSPHLLPVHLAFPFFVSYPPRPPSSLFLSIATCRWRPLQLYLPTSDECSPSIDILNRHSDSIGTPRPCKNAPNRSRLMQKYEPTLILVPY